MKSDRLALEEFTMLRIATTLLTLLGYLELANLLITANVLSLPFALVAFAAAQWLGDRDTDDAEAGAVP